MDDTEREVELAFVDAYIARQRGDETGAYIAEKRAERLREQAAER